MRLRVAGTAPTSSTRAFNHVLAWNIGANGLSKDIIASGRACPVLDTGVSIGLTFRDGSVLLYQFRVMPPYSY